MIVLFEGIVICFLLLLICLIGTANGPEGLVVLYEKDVQERAIKLGYTTKEKIKKSLISTSVAIFGPVLFLVPFMVYHINGGVGYWSAFWQMTIIMLLA